ncbi:MAG: hypothetical protein LBJ59_07635 [Zoogloeaceae bacterium]|jgi:hypothetical protein|nr:hypothetical protein [Zoogloeaceae bacterium]
MPSATLFLRGKNGFYRGVNKCSQTECAILSPFGVRRIREVAVEHNFERLKAHILPLSCSDRFEIARTERDLIGVEITEDFDNCPCGQEIKEHCYITNRITGNSTCVGNVCINRFLGIDTGTLFEGLKRIAKDPSANANLDVINHGLKLGFIYDSEYKFPVETRLKRKLSTKQLEWKCKINRRITQQIVVRHRTHT